MKSNKKIEKLNQTYSFNIFCLLGIFILVIRTYCFLTNKYDYNYATINYLIFPICFLLTFVISVFERIFTINITNNFFLKNKIFNIIKTIGVIVALIYITFLIYIFLYCAISVNKP